MIVVKAFINTVAQLRSAVLNWVLQSDFHRI